MNAAFFKDFQTNIKSEFVEYANYKKVSIIAEEYNKHNIGNNYHVTLTCQTTNDCAVMFRIEDFKEQTNYLKNGKRGPIKDNDVSLIDDNIYQIEIKRSNNLGGHKVTPQFEGGKIWLQHILRLSSPEHFGETNKIYNICLIIPKQVRSNLSRSKKNVTSKFILCDENEKFITYKLTDNSSKINITDLITTVVNRRSSQPHTILSL